MWKIVIVSFALVFCSIAVAEESSANSDQKDSGSNDFGSLFPSLPSLPNLPSLPTLPKMNLGQYAIPSMPVFPKIKSLTAEDIENMKKNNPDAIVNGVSTSFSSSKKFVNGKEVENESNGSYLVNDNGNVTKGEFSN